MGEIQFLVERLNDEPFNLGLTLVSFDDQTDLELLQLLNNVLSKLSDVHAVDLRDENPEQTGTRIVEFLHNLNYRHQMDPVDFKQSLLRGERATIHPILHYLLDGFEQHKTRAYLSRYLAPVKIPEDIVQSDEVLQEVFQQYRAAQVEFKKAHRLAARSRTTGGAPKQTKKELSQVEEEREQLVRRIAQTKQKLAQERPDYEGLLTLATKLRQEEDERPALARKLREHRQLLQIVNDNLSRLTVRIRDLETTADGGPEALFNSLEERVRDLGYQLEEKLPNDIRDLENRCEALNETLAQAEPSEFEVAQLEKTIVQAREALVPREREREKEMGEIDENMALFRQQVQGVTQKKNELMDRLDNTRREFDEADGVLNEVKGRLAEVADVKILRGDEFKKYVQGLRQKSAKYKSLKGDLTSIRAEWSILMRTEEILKSRADNLEGYMKQLEEKYGVGGYSEAQRALEEASRQKAMTDEEKGQTLEEISEVISRINRTIKDKQVVLAPQVRQLRTLREKHREIEGRLKEKTRAFESTMAGQRAEQQQAEIEMNEAREGYYREESKYHYLRAMSLCVTVSYQRALQEDGAKDTDLQLVGGRYKSHQEMFKALEEDQKSLSKQLRQRQKVVKEVHEPSMIQVQMFKNLQELLAVKRRCQLRDKEAQEAFEEVMQMDGGGRGEEGQTLVID